MDEIKKLNDEMKRNSLNDRNRNIGLANSTDSQLSGQLMLLCTVFLTVAFVVIGDNQTDTYSNTVKLLIFQVLVLTFFSLGCGIKNYFVTMDFYGDWAEKSHKNYLLFLEENYKNQTDLESKFNENIDALEQHSGTFWLRLQIISLASATLLFLVAIAIILF